MSSSSSSTTQVPNLHDIGPDWVLILGGVTRTGHRRAQRVTELAGNSGLDVVWFDGLVDDESPLETVPDETGSTTTVVVVTFGEELRRTMSGRMRSGDGLRQNALGRQVWRVLRKVGGLLQPRACWRVIEKDVRELANLTPPAGIVYTDDQAITSAWYASRIWRSAPVATDLPSVP